ncbi:hypothetical protein WDW86_10985 [Bdellovibrionota bacterium FG-2]
MIFVFEQGPRQHWLELSRGRFFLDQASYDTAKKRITARWILVDPKKGVSKRFDFGQNVYSPEDFEREFAKVGMCVTKKWGMLGGEPYTPTSWHQTLVVEKLE